MLIKSAAGCGAAHTKHRSPDASPHESAVTVRPMRSACLLAFVALVLTAGAARGDDRVDVGLMLGSTRATDEGAALAFGRALTYQATVAWRVWRNDRAAVSLEVPFL